MPVTESIHPGPPDYICHGQGHCTVCVRSQKNDMCTCVYVSNHIEIIGGVRSSLSEFRDGHGTCRYCLYGLRVCILLMCI